MAQPFPLFSSHAQYQLKERGIAEEEVVEALQKPMRFHYDQPKDAFSVRFEDRPYAESDEVAEGIIFDYDKKGKLMGFEVLDASKKLAPSFCGALLRQEIPISIGMYGTQAMPAGVVRERA